MARLRITTPPDAPHFKSGRACRVWLDDVEITKSVHRIDLHMGASEAIRADIQVYVKDLDIEVDTVVKKIPRTTVVTENWTQV
jgi:hypothetical protein